MIGLVRAEKSCAACGSRVRLPITRDFIPPVLLNRSGLDGRPSYDIALGAAHKRLVIDAAWLERELALEECESCGHLAPDVSFVYPRLGEAAEARAFILGLSAHAESARRYLAVADLYGDADARAEGFWILRAAWNDEAKGLLEPARGLRRRAGELLESALYQGYALHLNRGASSLILSEVFRAAGLFPRATEHVQRGLAATPEPLEESLLLVEASLIFEGEAQPYLRSQAEARAAGWSKEQREELSKRVSERSAPPPVRLRPLRTLDAVPRASMLEESRSFAQDFLTPELLIDLLRERRTGIWEGLLSRAELLPDLLRATAHEEASVRASAISLLWQTTDVQRSVRGDWREDPLAMASRIDALGSSSDDIARELVGSLCLILLLPPEAASALAGMVQVTLLSLLTDPAAIDLTNHVLQITARRLVPPAGTPPTTLTNVLRYLLQAVRGATMPTSTELADHLRTHARAITVPAPGRAAPKWASATTEPTEIYVELEGDVLGIVLHDDPRGWGAHADLTVARGTIDDIERLVGPMGDVPSMPYRLPELCAYVDFPQGRLSLFAAHEQEAVRKVTVMFNAPTSKLAAKPIRRVVASSMSDSATVSDEVLDERDRRIAASVALWNEQTKHLEQALAPSGHGSTNGTSS